MIRAGVATLLAGTLAAAAPVPEPTPVRLDAATVLIPGAIHPDRQPDGNSIVIAGSKGVLVIDTGRHAAHTAAVEHVVDATGRPLVLIVNTHWHLDHVSGNPALKRRWPGARVSASDAIDAALAGFLKTSAEGGRAALASGKLPEATAEDVRNDLATLDRSAELRPDNVVKVSRPLPGFDRPLELRLAKHAATAGDLWLYDRKAKRAIVGDLVTLPAPFLDTACPAGWSKALADVGRTPFRQLVPGHGPLMNRADFALYRTAFDQLLTCAAGNAPVATCGEGWTANAARLIPAADTRRATAMARYYAGLIRDGKLAGYCA